MCRHIYIRTAGTHLLQGLLIGSAGGQLRRQLGLCPGRAMRVVLGTFKLKLLLQGVNLCLKPAHSLQ